MAPSKETMLARGLLAVKDVQVLQHKNPIKLHVLMSVVVMKCRGTL